VCPLFIEAEYVVNAVREVEEVAADEFNEAVPIGIAHVTGDEATPVDARVRVRIPDTGV
jgi:hypothetical protein